MPNAVDIKWGTDKKGQKYLVDAEGRLLYTFFPAITTYDYETLEDWPEITRAWAHLWTPFGYDANRAPRVQGPKPERFDVDRIARPGSRTRSEVLLKVDLTWNRSQNPSVVTPYKLKLYTHKFDLSVDHYEVPKVRGTRTNAPPGFVRGLWHPASDTASVPDVLDLGELGEGTGGGYNAGP